MPTDSGGTTTRGAARRRATPDMVLGLALEIPREPHLGTGAEVKAAAVRQVTLPVNDSGVTSVTAAVHAPHSVRAPAVLLVPGAGGDLDGAGLVALAEVLAGLGSPVVRANLPYRQAGRRAPAAERSVAGFGAVFDAARQAVPKPRRWVVGGKSYGGRVASMAVAGGLKAVGLLLYGYPLHRPGKPQDLRVEHWPDVGVRTLFLQGERDPFCHLSALESHVHSLPRRTTLHVVEGGGHSLEVAASASPTGRRVAAPETIASLRPVLEKWLTALED